MAIEFEERPESRPSVSGENPTATRKYWCAGTTVNTDVVALALANSPAVWGGLVRQTIALDPQAADFWYVDVNYGKRRPGQYGDWKYSWDTTGGKQHITQSLQTVHAVAVPGRQPTNHHGAIGVTSEGIDGCDIVVPRFAFSISYFWDPSILSIAYAKALGAITGMRNNATFWGWGAGQVLFEGSTGNVEGNSEGTSPVEVQYKFLAELDVTESIAGMTVTKEAHHYTWFEYQETKDTTSKRVARRPIAAYTERVNWQADFSIMGIGT